MEVMGFEPTASTLRMYGPQRFDEVFSDGLPGSNVAIPSGPLRSPQDPSRSLSIRSRKVTPERSRRVATDRHLGPVGGAPTAQRMALVHNQFLSERRDITTPKRRSFLPGR